MDNWFILLRWLECYSRSYNFFFSSWLSKADESDEKKDPTDNDSNIIKRLVIMNKKTYSCYTNLMICIVELPT